MWKFGKKNFRMENPPKEKKSLSATALILICILLALILTYIVPAGEFATESGETLTLDSFTWRENTPVSLLAIPELIVESFSDNASVIFAFFFVGGAVGIMVQTGAMQALVAWLLKKAKGRHFLIIAGFTCVFTLLSLNIASRYLISFVPFMIAFAVSLGYDAITGLSIVLLGSAMSYCTSPTGLTTLTAQSYVNLQPLSGSGFRWICLIALLVPTLLYIYFYSEKVRKNKVAGYPPPAELPHLSDGDSSAPWRKGLVVAIYLITILFCVYYGSQGSLTTTRMSAVFMVAAIVLALVNYVSPNDVIDHYIQSAGRFFAPAMIVGLAGTISLVLEQGHVVDTIVYALTLALQKFPTGIKAPIMFLVQLLVNCVIVPGAGQAAITMPLFGPVAELAGFPVQSAVLAFNFGSGIGDFVLPYSSMLVSYLSISGVSFRAWWKFVWKLFVIWVLVSCVLMYISTLVWA